MSGPLSTLTASLTRVSTRRRDAQARARMERLAQGQVFQGFARLPEVRRFGDFQAARRALRGTLSLGSFQVPLSGITPWEENVKGEAALDALHGFAWLDDFAALDGKAARATAQNWVLGWLDRYMDGTGPGWQAGLAGQRLQRLMTHIEFLRKGLAPELVTRIEASLPVHLAFVAETTAEMRGDLSRFAAASGWIHGAFCLTGAGPQRVPALEQLSADLAEQVSDRGELTSRNPSDLLAVFEILLDVRALLSAADHPKSPGVEDAVARITPALRLLRHGDGSLARFHGGSSGAEGALDRALAESRIRTRPTDAPALGYVRLHGGRVQVIVDCARPPERLDSAHASTLAFEMSSGRRPILVNCGPTLDHLPALRRIPRTTAAHNALGLDRVSSSRFGPLRVAGRAGMDALVARPSMVTLARAQDSSGMWIQARHDGYLSDYGLLHERRLFVGALGHQVLGEEVLLAPDVRAQRRFSNRIKGAAKLGIALSVHFHLHPDVSAEQAQGAVRLGLSSGETWVFRAAGADIDMEPSIFIDPNAPEPLATRQIVLGGRTRTHKAEVSWSLTRENASARAVRDASVTPLRKRQSTIDPTAKDRQ